ncbi:hypothetical protein C0J52_03037 [Blattella germanica]|nr:hypothetical protein C0J52_03037 [Blattella germanica]
MQVPQHVPQHVISRFGDINWPARSPDLSAPDYFLWCYLKGKVYQERPHTIQQLKENIETEIQQIPRDMLHSVMENVRRLAQRFVSGWWSSHEQSYFQEMSRKQNGILQGTFLCYSILLFSQ